MKLRPGEAALVAAAREARRLAYAPYSRFKVGVALLLNDGRVITGVNVENCSYGLTVCAERNAIAAAVSAGAKPGDVLAVAIVTKATAATSPCGACRQVLAEFCRPTTRIVLHNVADGATAPVTLASLLPRAFTPDNMPDR
ncbi:MAG: cytidine deaminase [Deltaproteobacteria bacterium]|nr:cytidine deaminase [Deltaproteobacteria bacterium]